MYNIGGRRGYPIIGRYNHAYEMANESTTDSVTLVSAESVRRALSVHVEKTYDFLLHPVLHRIMVSHFVFNVQSFGFHAFR